MALFVGDIEAGTEVWGVSSNNIIPDLQRTGFSMGDNEFDYIIVGGGSAGCVLAHRLTECGKLKVCLLEAGPRDWNPFISIPAGVIALIRGVFCNWRFWSEPQKHLNNRRLYQPRGKVLGGSSAINATVCNRGHKRDFDHWQALGNPGWSYDDVLPFFRKCENFEPFDKTNDAGKYHGKDGPLNVAERRTHNPLSLTFVSAGMQAGYPLNEDFNGADQYGVGLYHVFQKGGLRCSNARAYLKLARWRANLTVVTGAHVTKVLIENGVAEGVEFKRQGSMKTVRARREVILSAGAFQSPQVLMLSGVGDPAELSRFDIPVKAELPGVGKNLQDHLDIFVETREKTKFSVSLRLETLPKMLWQTFLLLFFRKGTLTSNVAESGGFYHSGIGGEEGVPDIQWHMAVSMNAKHGLDLTRVRKYFGYSVMNYDLRPLSRGRVGLHSADPLAPPLIDPALGSHERDIDRLVYAVKETRRVLAQPAFDPHRGGETAPGPHIQTDEQLREWVRETAEVAYHPVGTCKMGPASDAMSVVDARLKVRGVKGLRVVDCSIMPTLVGGNTNQPATMIGEKGAQMILEDCGALE
jgi:choline dehydrogenase-like flavoprotein